MALKTKPAPKPKIPVKTSKPAAKATSKPAAAKGKDFDDTNRGVLFFNDKQGNDARPDLTGKINIDGVEKRLAVWVKPSDRVEGGKYFSILASDFPSE